MQMFFSFIIWLLIGAATSYFANQRGRDPFIWFMIGMFLGLLGLLLVFLMPSLESREQDSEDLEEHIIESAQDSELLSNVQEYLLKDWFYLDAMRQQQGPVGFEALKTVWGEGNLSEESYVWCEGMDQWKKVEEIPDLRAALLSL